MKKSICILVLTMLCMVSCACANNTDIGVIGGADGPTSIVVAKKGENAVYEQITQEKAKEYMDSGEELVILDVREQSEYDAGHIPKALLIPHTEIEDRAADLIPDKDTLILVYCRSGRRSKIASESLVNMGYTNVKEFGGINDWKYEIEE